MGKSRLTQRDVARHAGVSQAVVSYVLNNAATSRIPEETRNRVLRSIEELGYVPHGVARGMRTGRSMMIGLVIPDITNPFYPAFQRGVQDVADKAGFSLVTFNSDGLRSRELASMRNALQVGVDGLIVSLFQAVPEDLEMIHSRNIPLVVYGVLQGQDEPLYDVIDVDAELATREVVEYLFQRGHRTIALIDGPEDISRIQPRITAYRQSMERLGLEVHNGLIARTDFSEQSGYQAMSSILTTMPRPTGVVAANDVVAMGALARVHEEGLKVPEDIAIVGFDDIPAARLLRPALTTVSLFPHNIGACSVQMLLDRIEGSVAERGRVITMPHKLIIRNSA